MNLNLICQIIMFAGGVSILCFVMYVNWWPGVKARSIEWIAKIIYKRSAGALVSAENLFMTVSSFLLAAGGILIIVSIVLILHL